MLLSKVNVAGRQNISVWYSVTVCVQTKVESVREIIGRILMLVEI